jgi:fluoride ion exporter CrcB/FEX
MGIGISIFVGTVGAILRYAVTAPTNQHGFNIHTGGIILMIVGAIGLVLSTIFWRGVSPFGTRDHSSSRSEETVTQNGQEQGHVVRQTETRDHVSS